MSVHVSKVLAAAMLIAAVPVSSVDAQPASASPLNDFGRLIVGSWTGGGVYAADYPGYGKKGEKFTNSFTCRWTAGRAAIACEGRSNESSWVSQYWWDPGAKVVRILTVDDAGNVDQGTLVSGGARLVWTSSGHFTDGRKVDFDWETVFENNGNTHIVAGATVVGGERNEYRDTYERVRN